MFLDLSRIVNCNCNLSRAVHFLSLTLFFLLYHQNKTVLYISIVIAWNRQQQFNIERCNQQSFKNLFQKSLAHREKGKLFKFLRESTKKMRWKVKIVKLHFTRQPTNGIELAQSPVDRTCFFSSSNDLFRFACLISLFMPFNYDDNISFHSPLLKQSKNKSGTLQRIFSCFVLGTKSQFSLLLNEINVPYKMLLFA